jgi:4-carboxymuconolactone decarboxylase
MSEESTLYEKGRAVRREVMGREFADRQLANDDDFMGEFQKFVTTHLWGTVWTRDGLPRRTRSLLAITALTLLNRPQDVKMHVHGAIANGATKAEILETLMQAALYAGFPPAMGSVRAAEEAFAEMAARAAAER